MSNDNFKAKCVPETDCHKRLEDRISKLEREFDIIMQGFEARELGKDAEKKAMNFIWAGCDKRPFQINSLNNLIQFVNDPTVDDFCGPDACESWTKLSNNVKCGIKRRIKEVEVHNRYLKVSIYTLTHDDFEPNNSEIDDAIKVCESYLNNSSS